MELLSEDDLRLQIWNSRGIELPQDWDREQILDWYEKDLGSEPPIRGSSEIVATVPNIIDGALLRRPEGPKVLGIVGQPLASLSPTATRFRTSQNIPRISEPQPITTRVQLQLPEKTEPLVVTTELRPKLERVELFTELELKLKNVSQLREYLRQNYLTVPRLKSDMVDKLLEAGLDKQGQITATRELQKSEEAGKTEEIETIGIPVLPLKGPLDQTGDYEVSSKPIQTNYSTLKALRDRLPTAMPVNKNAAFQDKVPANPEAIVALIEAPVQVSEIPVQVREPLPPIEPIIQPQIEPVTLEPELFTKLDLQLKTVNELKQLLRQNDLTPPRLKAAMVDLLLEEGLDKEGKIRSKRPAVPLPVVSEPVVPIVQVPITPEPIVSIAPEPIVSIAPEPVVPLPVVPEPVIPQVMEPELFTELDLKLKTVNDLKEYLRRNNLNVPRLKAQMINLLLQEGLDTEGNIRSKRLQMTSEPQIQPQLVTVQPEPQIQPVPIQPAQPQIQPVQPQIQPAVEEFTKTELQLKNVTQLREYLRQNNLRLPKLKADMIDLLLAEGLDKQGQIRSKRTISKVIEEPQTTPMQPVVRSPSPRPSSRRARRLSEQRLELPEIQPVEEPLSISPVVPVAPVTFQQPEPKEVEPLRPEIRPVQIRITPRQARVPEGRQPISTQFATPELETRIQSGLTRGGSVRPVPILVTPQNVGSVRLPVYPTRSTRLTPIPKTPLTEKGEEKELIQKYTPQQMSIEKLMNLRIGGKPFDPEMISAENARSGYDIYKSKELQEIAKTLGIKITGNKATLAVNIKAELERIGYVQPAASTS